MFISCQLPHDNLFEASHFIDDWTANFTFDRLFWLICGPYAIPLFFIIHWNNIEFFFIYNINVTTKRESLWISEDVHLFTSWTSDAFYVLYYTHRRRLDCVCVFFFFFAHSQTCVAYEAQFKHNRKYFGSLSLPFHWRQSKTLVSLMLNSFALIRLSICWAHPQNNVLNWCSIEF